MSCQIPNNIEGVDADGICEITFHVHMPNKFDRSLQPVVLGSVRELGNWSCPVVKLRQNDTNSTYWFSDPVKICIKDHSIHYKYALYQPIKEKQDMFDIIRDKVLGDRTIVMEGNSDNDNRLLSYRGFQYDVWKDNYYKKLYSPDLTKDYKFVYVVYESVTLENIKEKIKEFQALLKYQPSLTADAVDITLIRNLVASSREDYQRIFICFLLAFYINVTQERMEHHTRVRLPENFPSINLLQALEKIRSEDIPSDARILFTLATSALVRHNSSKRNVFDWMKMFAIAPVVDPLYTFLVNIEKHNYDQRNQVLNFYNLLKRNVKPYLDRIDRPHIYQSAIEKIIEISFFDMESCDFLMHEMIGKERMDERIKRSIHKFVSQYIDSDDPRNLKQHFKFISEDLRVECAPVFRRHFSKFLSNNRISWKSEYSEPMFYLFAQLFTAETDIMQALVLLTKSRNVDLLLSFPKWLKLTLESKNVKIDFKAKIPALCEEWYSTIISAVTNQKDIRNPVIFLYQQLSAISFVLQRRPDIYKKLVDTVEQKILNLPQEWLFKATSFVGKLESRIVGDFEKVLRQRLKSPLSSDTNDDAVIKIISQICNSSGSSLDVPNRLCENVLCHILDKIRDKAIVSKIHNASNDHLQLLHFKSSKLWIFLLNATGEVNELFNHPHVESVRSKISQLVRAIEDQSIMIKMLNPLLEFPNDILTSYFNAGIGTKEKKITNEMLDSLREQLREHLNTVENLFSFYNRWCNKAEDTQAYLDDLTEKVNNMNNIPFLEMINPDYWSIHNEIIEVSRRAYQYENSQTFANVFEADTNEEVKKSVFLVSQAFGNSLLERYQRICIEYENWKHIRCCEARPLWNGIASEQVKHELDQMVGDATWYRQTQNDLLRSIECLVQFPSLFAQLENLSNVLTQFNIKNKEKCWAIEMLNTLENTNIILGDLQDFLKKYNRKFGAYRECWSLIKELSFAEEFIDFLLKKLVGRDLTNLIDAVDDLSDTKLLQEKIVDALIEVNEALTPLSEESSRSSIDSFLNCLSEVSKKHSSLASKIGYCSSHNLTLQNMYHNIAIRGEVTKERIKNAATFGLYTFQHVEKTNLCEVVLTYDTTQNHDDTNSTPRVTASYNLADLHDHALLIGKYRASTDRSSGENDIQDIHKDINTFITQVDLVQQIIDVASKLIQLGHFLYQKMKVEARGVSELQDVLDKLAQDLKTWEDIVIRAQNEHYYLTFFSARHILAFYNYFRTDNLEQDDKLKEVCQNLIRFVNDAAQLPIKTGKWNTVQNQDDIFPVLCKIGAILYDIFSDIPQQIRSIPDTLKLVIADTVFRGQIFVAACHSHSLVPNVILSLFANHQSFPKPWQILICQSTTAAEEITLFIKRSFIAADNEYKDYLFCIANVEFLDFELQDILIRTIHNFKQKKKDYLLALVCTYEYGRNHHILDKFVENVHVTDGLDAESMELLYQEIRPDVECVTSKMSGQGKTEWIKEFSFQREKVPRTLLISDGAHFRTLVRQLADCNLRAVESLHLDIRFITHPYEVNFFLFELLTFKVVSNGFDIVHLPDTLIFIEIASTIKHYLLDSLPIIKYLRRQNLEWNMDNLMVSRHVNSPVQIVSRYLDQYSRETIDEENIRFTGDNAIGEPLPAERCRQLLRQYFFDGQKDDIHSYRFLEIFMNLLADQLVRFSESSFFKIEQLRVMIQETNIRSSLLKILITCSKEFATRAINFKNKQEENNRAIQEGDTQDIDNVRLGNVTQWNDSNHLMIVFLSQMPDSICALYREKNKVPNNVKNLLKSQNAELQDYDSMEPSLLLERLEQLVRQKMHKLDGLPKYALSIENLLKMAMILLRSRANIPVVCCGEAGCGKTSLISFLSMIMEVNFVTLNLHAGIHEDDIQNFMNEATKLAQKGETWVFFDEINTCDHIGMFGNLIAHRLLNGRLIHPNIRIFAACNPYRLRIKAQSSVGHSATQYEEKNILAYRRKNYRKKMIEIIKNHQPNFNTPPNARNDAFEMIIRNEQDEYVKHMKNCPDGTAWNEALLENILVIIVCIQTRIPVFIIGAPGSSKSLAVRIISMNLHGIDSKDSYLRTLPQVYMIPYQGSSLSISEGIEKVFQSAQNYQVCSSKENPVTSVVLLDQVGLAETSPHNPLKVLHGLLETPLSSKDDVPAVSVIGISNWRLDKGKSSRALLVQRPLFAESDLVDTAECLLSGTKCFDNINLFLKKLADSYLRYIKNQRFANFHGLRDYYFLIKSIRSMCKKDKKPNIQLALARNFGGADNMEELCTIYFQIVLKPVHLSKFTYTPIPVQELINANLAEKDARNLMLIGNGNFIVTFLTYQLCQQNIEPVVIIGSQFPEDIDGVDYSYATLNRIMMCVETGRCLILTDLEMIYDSLYDLFNQHFIMAENSSDENNQRNYIRIGITPYSNPMLYGKCILVLDEAKLPYADPALLNRFEKQKLTLEETLAEREAMIFTLLKEWTHLISSIHELSDEDAEVHFKEKDMFIGFSSEETLQSLIIDQCKKNPDSDDDTIISLCKESLISIATSDSIVRADKSLLNLSDPLEVKEWQRVYFQNQRHGNVREFFRALLNDDLTGHLTIINTFSDINTDIKSCMNGISSCQVDKLSTFRSEAKLQEQIKRFL
ncbi:12126_t:CDS:10 [Acaulospora morrowiae]|uniref:12126_t:CDS:1 n=1 Tax=Acaulospora morrowiae TaxID=94023 RepID=A0A9N9FMH6_9GLOM|nr:12126_t:CDS:10 [Acaulospora morrowiae]